jgi:hypothetical protein
MQSKLILFNGPRHSGKDTAAIHCQQQFGAYHFKLSGPIKAAIKSMFELKDETVELLEEVKTQAIPVLFDNSYVDCQISFSEDWAKKLFGNYVFGNLAARHVNRHILEHPEQELYVCSDSGFAAEAEPLIRLFGPKNCLLVKLHRPGKTFEGDSRSYISLDEVKTVELSNDYDTEIYCQSIDDLVTSWLLELHGTI